MAELQKLDKTLVIDLGLLILLATVVRLVGVGVAHLPVGDEMFHVLAAQSWAMEGSLRIADGSYDRAALFTMLIGELFSIFGDSLVVARIPVLIFGVIWALVLFIWVRKSAGRLAAWIAAGLFCTAPHAIELSLYCRMDTLHGTFFFIGMHCSLLDAFRSPYIGQENIFNRYQRTMPCSGQTFTARYCDW
ncbi:MAG: ArnT family glycosyltransferase, partial [Pseudomonadales bacterium]